MGGNVLVSPEEPTILASVTEFPLLREFRERAPRTGAPEHSTERVAAEVREAWVRSDSAALHTAGRRLFRSPGASGLAREALALGDLAAGRLGPPPTGMSVPWAADPLLWLAPHLVPELLGEEFGTYRTCAALLERLRSRGFPEGRGDDRALRGEQGGQDTSGRAPPATLGQLTSSAVALGRWSAATDHAAEGLALARLGGHAIEVAGLLAQLAWIAAARGRVADCRRLAAEADAIATPKGCTLITAIIKWALGLLDLTLGHPACALDRLAPLASSSGSTPVLLLATGDLVEAAVRCGRPAAAEPLLAQLDRWVELAGPAWALATTFRCRALLATGDEAEICFQAALEAGGGSVRPFAHARTELDYGAWLRRHRPWTQARTRLRAALETFERLGAWPWAERARTELLAAGASARWPEGHGIWPHDRGAGAHWGGGVRPAARGRC
jgi:hypothetical protein